MGTQQPGSRLISPPSVVILICVLLILTIGRPVGTPSVHFRDLVATEAFSFSDHARITQAAALILANDGKPWRLDAATVERPDRTYLQGIVTGVVLADSPDGTFWTRHAHNPRTHKGWQLTGPKIVCPDSVRSAADEAQTFFLDAVNWWNSGKDYTAMVSLGIALHHVQDPSVPHHAEGSPQSSGGHIPYIDQGICGGNGSHDRYENWVKKNFGHPLFPHARTGGLYNLSDPSVWAGGVIHSAPTTAYAWADNAAHEARIRYPDVNDIPPGETDCAPLPSTDSNCYRVAKDLVPSAERRSAGFINFFFTTIGPQLNFNASTGVYHPESAGNLQDGTAFVIVSNSSVTPFTAILQGPAAWNGGQPVTVLGLQFIYGVFLNIPPVSGQYSITISANGQQFLRSAVIDTSQRLTAPASVQINSLTLSTIAFSWTPVAGAQSYSVFSISEFCTLPDPRLCPRLPGASRFFPSSTTSATITGLSFVAGRQYFIIMEAYNWDIIGLPFQVPAQFNIGFRAYPPFTAGIQAR